jgi:pyruvate carboxylase
MLRAIEEYEITGIQTTLPFCEYVFKHEAFIDGSFDTKFVDKYFTPENLQDVDEEVELVAGIMAAVVSDKSGATNGNNNQFESNHSPWRKRLHD